MAKEKAGGKVFRTSIGGQALMEGILMRGVDKQSVVVRTADGLVTKVEPVSVPKDKYPILGWPFIRGVVTFVDSMVKGMQALTYSASFLPEDEQEEPSKLDKWVEEKFGMEKAEKFVIAVAMVMGLALAVGLFIVLPTFLIGLIPGLKSGHDGLRTLLEGVVKIIILLVYMWGVSQMKDIKRVFRYHGAEHKTIFCYEHRKELTVDNVREESRFHPRCGTSFILVVVIISIFVFILVNAFLGINNMFLRMLVKLCLLPFVVAISYEFNRFLGRHDDKLYSRILSWPGRQLQRLTTAEPDDGMMEVAITALKLVIPDVEGADAI